MLAIALDSEYNLDLYMYKVLKMLTLHETEENLMEDYTLRAGITLEEKLILGKEMVKKVTDGLLNQEEIENLLNEFNAHETKESVFCYHIDKIECDFQAKIYDLEGVFPYKNAKGDLKYFGDRAIEVEKNSKCASDIWIEYDRPKYEDDQIFMNLLNKIQNIKEL